MANKKTKNINNVQLRALQLLDLYCILDQCLNVTGPKGILALAKTSYPSSPNTGHHYLLTDCSLVSPFRAPLTHTPHSTSLERSDYTERFKFGF
ncbi:hypothetical protein J6590_035048 [Homalodisca vitripennis]|nr:hypothetical protein J6590_035048 [Homalodisca vitripennis]